MSASPEVDTIRARALQAAQYYHKNVLPNGGSITGITTPPPHPPPQHSAFLRASKDMHRSSLRVNGTVRTGEDALRAGVTPNSEKTHLMMKAQGSEYGSNMRLGDYRPPSNQSIEHHDKKPTPTGDHRITPLPFEGAMTHNSSSNYISIRGSPKLSNRTIHHNRSNTYPDARSNDRTDSAFTQVHAKESRNERLHPSNFSGHSTKRHNTSPDNRYDVFNKSRQDKNGALTTDNINLHMRNEYFKGDFPVRRSNSNSTLNDTLDRLGSSSHVDAVPHREYGSTSSMDMHSISGESFFQMLREFRTDIDQRSPAPPQLEKLLGGGHVTFATKVVTHTTSSSKTTIASAELKPVTEVSASPKLARKNTSKKEKDKEKEKDNNKPLKVKSQSGEKSLFSKLRGSKGEGDSMDSDLQRKLEERARQKAFAHYDCQSMAVDLNDVMKNSQQVGRRKNTTTGASAASRGSNPNTPQGSREDLSDEDADYGDNKNNDLVLSCPYFRNEIGGEEERNISLSRVSVDGARPSQRGSYEAILEGAKVGLTGGSPGSPDNPAYWTQPAIERVDYGAHYYRDYFYGQEHQNYLGIDENLGPVAISVKREKLDEKDVIGGVGNANKDISTAQYQYRIIVRTSELSTLRGSILEDCIPSATKHGTSRGLPIRDVLEYIVPEIQLSSLRTSLSTDKVQEQLMKLDEQGINNKYKVGVMFCKAGQNTEEEMYNNENSSPALDEFLESIGETVRLKNFDRYRAQLDNRTDSTGTHSLYTTYQNNEIMFHISTMLPHTPNNKQQLLRKRHIGNDIVTIVFQEPGAKAFTPKTIRSHFQHVFIIVRVHHPNTDSLCYSVAVARSKEVPPFGPPLPDNPTFSKSKSFTDFLLSKIINAENAAHRSDKFVAMAVRTRQEYLRDLANNYVSNTTIDSGTKFTKFTLWDKKKEKSHPKALPETISKGAIIWRVQVEDFSQAERLECILGISSETFVLVDVESKEPVFSVPCKSVIGWTLQKNCLKIHYNEGECIIIYCVDPEIEEIIDIVHRLSLVTDGCETTEMTLRRNGLGQLGFHVHYQGLVADVEQYGFAWQAGLRKGCRLVEICKVAVCTLTHDQMIDLLRTSMTVKVVIIPPHEDGSPRRGLPTVEITGVPGNYHSIDFYHRNQSSKLHPAKGQAIPPCVPEREHSPHSRSSSSPASVLTGTKLTPPASRNEQKLRLPPDYSLSKRDNPPSYNEARTTTAVNLEQRFQSSEVEKRKDDKNIHDNERYRGEGDSGRQRRTSGDRSQKPSHHLSNENHSSGLDSSLDSSRMSRESDAMLSRESRERQSARSSKNARHLQNMQAHANRQGQQFAANRSAYHDAKQTNAMSRLPLSCSAASAFTEAEKFTPAPKHAASVSISSGDTSLTSTSGTSTSTATSEEKWYDTGDEFHEDEVSGIIAADVTYDAVSQDTANVKTHARYWDTERPAHVEHLSHPPINPPFLHKTYPPRERDMHRKHQPALPSENSAFEKPVNSITNLSEISSHSGSSNRSSRSRQSTPSQMAHGSRSPLIVRHAMHSASPDIREIKKSVSSSSDGSSPKPSSRLMSSNESLTSRLRPGATAKSAPKYPVHQPTSIKEDLLKLINPDIPDSEITRGSSKPRRAGMLQSTPATFTRLSLHRTLSDESLSGGGTTRKLRRESALDVPNDLIFTSTKKSTFPSRMTVQTTNIRGGDHTAIDKTVVSGNSGGSLFPLPDSGSSLEWSSLVETAKSFEGLDMQSVKSASIGTLDEIAESMPEFQLQPTATSNTRQQTHHVTRNHERRHTDLAFSNGFDSTNKIRSGGGERKAELNAGDLEIQLQQLTRQLSKERHERLALESEVNQLREDNVRLQEESQTAATQLRKFTEWFFNTIDRQ